MIRKTAKTMIFRRSFFNTYFDEPLSAGDYRVETDEDFLEGLSFPAYRPDSDRHACSSPVGGDGAAHDGPASPTINKSRMFGGHYHLRRDRKAFSTNTMNAVFQQISIKAGNAFRVISVVGEMRNELYRGRPVSPRSPINMIRTVGAVTFAIGVALLCSAFIETYVPAEKLFQVMNGYPSDRLIWYIAVGVATASSGGVLALFGTRK